MNAPRHPVVSWWFCLAIALGTALLLRGQGNPDRPQPVEWAPTDLSGAVIKVPADKKPTVLLFVLPGQPQSLQAIEQLKSAIGAIDAQVALVVSGKDALADARKLAETLKPAWPVIADADYAGSGKLSVHVWPTTVIVRSDGRQVAHLAGVPKSYAKDLESYLQYAAEAIDEQELKHRLEAHDTVVDSARQMADRHLTVARRLLDKGLAQQARVELERGLKLQPDHAGLQTAMIDVLLDLRDAQSAIELLDKLDSAAVSPPRLKLLRGRTLIALGKWDEAESALIAAATLNPQPAEAYYELGRVYQHQQKWEQAAQAFRRAFESTPDGRKLSVTDSPATQPAAQP